MIDGREKQTSVSNRSGSITGEEGVVRRLTTTARHPRPSPKKKLEPETSCSEASPPPPYPRGMRGGKQESTDNSGSQRLPPEESLGSAIFTLNTLLFGVVLLFGCWQLAACPNLGVEAVQVPPGPGQLDLPTEPGEEDRIRRIGMTYSEYARWAKYETFRRLRSWVAPDSDKSSVGALGSLRQDVRWRLAYLWDQYHRDQLAKDELSQLLLAKGQEMWDGPSLFEGPVRTWVQAMDRIFSLNPMLPEDWPVRTALTTEAVQQLKSFFTAFKPTLPKSTLLNSGPVTPLAPLPLGTVGTTQTPRSNLTQAIKKGEMGLQPVFPLFLRTLVLGRYGGTRDKLEYDLLQLAATSRRNSLL